MLSNPRQPRLFQLDEIATCARPRLAAHAKPCIGAGMRMVLEATLWMLVTVNQHSAPKPASCRIEHAPMTHSSPIVVEPRMRAKARSTVVHSISTLQSIVTVSGFSIVTPASINSPLCVYGTRIDLGQLNRLLMPSTSAGSQCA